VRGRKDGEDGDDDEVFQVSMIVTIVGAQRGSASSHYSTHSP
jgi:hypothetical protein